MRSLYLYAILLIAVLFCGSCTVEKRLHQPGWHVEWRKQLPTATADERSATQATPVGEAAPVNSKSCVPASTLHDATDTGQEDAPSESSLIREEETCSGKITETERKDDTLRRKVIVVDERKLPKRADVTTATPVERDPMTVVLWIMSALSMVAIAVCIVLAFASVGELFLLGFFLIELPFLLLTRTIMALLIRRRERRYPGRYRRSEHVALAVLLPELFLLFALILLVLYVVLGFGWI